MKYKEFLDYKFSEIGLGTYLGNPDEEVNQNYQQTIETAIDQGVTVIDTALNYRYMQSEKTIAKVLKKIARDKAIISTKGGFISFDSDSEHSYVDYVQRNFLDTGLVPREDIAHQHSLEEDYIEWCFNKSLENLATDYIDIYFIHNPESYLARAGKEKFKLRLRENFYRLENQIKAGKLKYYGLATWDGFRVEPENPAYLGLEELHSIAKEVAGDDHHFKFIQLPYNIAMPEAYTIDNQKSERTVTSTLKTAEQLGIYPYTSATLLQGKTVKPYADNIKKIFKVEKNAHVPIQFARSTPGIGSTLIGMSSLDHLKENLSIQDIKPLDKKELESVFIEV